MDVQTSNKNSCILVVDDNEEIRQTLKPAISQILIPSQVLCTSNADQALTMAADNTLDVILLDVGADGYIKNTFELREVSDESSEGEGATFTIRLPLIGPN